MSVADKVRENFRQAQKALTAHSEAIVAFQAACALGQWDQIEMHRAQALGSLDQWFDNLAAAHRQAQDGG